MRTGEKKTSNPAADRRDRMFQSVNMEDLNDSNITNHNEACTSVAIPDDSDHRLVDSDIGNNTINIFTAIEDSDDVLKVPLAPMSRQAGYSQLWERIRSR